MNEKGFTIVEVVISFVLLAAILAALFGFVITYRDNIRNEEIRTQLLDYKNTITKIIYDEIVRGNYVKIENCDGKDNCVNFIDTNNEMHVLEKVEVLENSQTLTRGLYLNHDGKYYLLPDSDLKDENGYKCSFDNFSLHHYNNLYSLKIPFTHSGLNDKYEIMLVIS